MTTYYKAVTMDYRDFYSGQVDYSVGSTVVHPNPGFYGDCDTFGAAGYLSITTDPTGCVGAQWPMRLLEVEADFVWQPHTHNDYAAYRQKRATHKLTVLREVDAWQVFGPQGERVADLATRSLELWEARCDMNLNEELFDKCMQLSSFSTLNIYSSFRNTSVSRVERDVSLGAVPYTDIIDAIQVIILWDLMDETNPAHRKLMQSAESVISEFEKIYIEYKNGPAPTFWGKVVKRFPWI